MIENSLLDLMRSVGRKDGTKFRTKFGTPLIEDGLMEMTIPEKPRSRLGKCRLTAKGRAVAAAAK